MKKLLVILAGGVMLFLSACEWETIVPKVVELPDEPVSFATQIAPIFVDAGCIACHGNSGGLDLHADKSYAGLTNGRVDTANPAGSIIIVYINKGGAHGTAGNVTAEQKALLLKWIEEGAKDN